MLAHMLLCVCVCVCVCIYIYIYIYIYKLLHFSLLFLWKIINFPELKMNMCKIYIKLKNMI